MKTIYIPWFWNNEDRIFQNYLNWEWDIVQLNLKNISDEQLLSFMKWKSFEEIFWILKKHYLDTDENILKQVIEKWANFKWFTRKVSTTISLTAKNILKIVQWEPYKIVWHSQWWLITIKAILENLKLLSNLKEIHLLAPVSDLNTWGDFHKWKEAWYMNGKWVIVRPEYIWEFKWDNNLFYKLLDILKKLHWQWTLKLKIWKFDRVIPIKKFDIDRIKKLYSEIELELIEWDHYLWY